MIDLKEMNKMVNVDYANAYKEVLEVLNNLVKTDYEKIPKEYIKFLKNNCNNDYKFEYDKTKSFKEQVLLEDTKYILFGIFEKFGATEKQKNLIKSFKMNYYNKLEEQKKEKYNTDIFLKDRNVKDNTNKIVQHTELVEVKKSNFLKRIFDKIKRWLKK